MTVDIYLPPKIMPHFSRIVAILTYEILDRVPGVTDRSPTFVGHERSEPGVSRWSLPCIDEHLSSVLRGVCFALGWTPDTLIDTNADSLQQEIERAATEA